MSIIDMSDKPSELEILTTFGQVRRQLNLIATQGLKPLGIGPKQAILLRAISRMREASLAELSRATFTDPAATGRTIDNLIRKGWVEQMEDPTDRRRWRVQLTKRGNKLVEQVDTIYRKIATNAFEPLGEKEKAQFLAILKKIQGHFPASESPESAK